MGYGGEVTNPTSPRHFSWHSSKGGSVIPVAGEPPEHTIDCGDIVWGMAFGSSVPEKQSRCINIEWHRFQFGQDQLLLATGLNNGRIKIWDVYTGESRRGPPCQRRAGRTLTFGLWRESACCCLVASVEAWPSGVAV